MPSKSLEVGPSGAADIPLVAADLWALYLKNANERATARAELWNRSLGAFLLFAGLFVGVVSSFVISSAGGFQTDPQVNLLTNISATLSDTAAGHSTSGFPSTTVAINFLWFSSLTFTLISALAAVLAQTWLANFSFIPTKGFNGAMERWIHDDNAHKWRLHKAITWITVLIQLSLFLFLAGFALQAVVDDRSLGWLIVALVGLTLVVYIFITALPWISPKTPFRTPFSDLTVHTQRPEDAFEDPESPTPPGGKPLSERPRASLLSIYRGLMKTPSKTHIELGIYSSFLKDNSSTNAVLDAAVAELRDVTKLGLSPEHCESLLEFGLPAALCLRLKQLCQPRAEQNRTLVQRMKIYLLAIMWMVNEQTNPASKLARAFAPLLRTEDGPLLKLETLPAECQAIAFGVRTYLLAAGCKFGDISSTDWFRMVEHLEPRSPSTVFRAVAHGLEMNRQEISHDCARVLAIYMHSDRFAVETVKSKGDPVEFVRKFFAQLENAWKFSVCSSAVRLLEEDRFDHQITALEALSNLAQDDAFRETMDGVLPALLGTLGRVNWRTSVSCLQQLSKMYKQDIFRESMRGILPKFVLLLAEPSKAVRDAVVQLLNLMDPGELTGAVNHYHHLLIRNLKSRDMRARIGSVRILTELARTEKMPKMIQKFIPDVVACADTEDEELRLNVIQIFQELRKQKIFHPDIDASMADIVKLVGDEDWSVQDEIVEFISTLTVEVDLRPAINRNIPAMVTDHLSSPYWFTRQNALRVFSKLVESGVYPNAINNAFPDVADRLSDEDAHVRDAALQAIFAIAQSDMQASHSVMTDDVVVTVSRKFTDEEQNVRISAFRTFSAIVELHKDTFQNAIMTVVPVVISPLTTDSKTQVAVLETLSTLAKTDTFAEMVNDVLEQIIALLSDASIPNHVRIRVLQMLISLAPKSTFHDKLKAAIPQIALLLESKEIGTTATTTLVVFATHDLFIGSSSDVISQIVSILSEGNFYTSESILRLLFTIETQAMQSPVEKTSDTTVFKYSLGHIDDRVRLAGIRNLRTLFRNKPSPQQISLTILDVAKRLHDESEEIQSIALDIWIMLKYKTQLGSGTSRDQLDAALEDVHCTMALLLSSHSEAISAQVIQMLASMATVATPVRKAESKSPILDFQEEVDHAAGVIIKLLVNGTDQRRITMIHTILDFVKTDVSRSNGFQKVIKHVTGLLSDPKADVRLATLKVFRAISTQDFFATTVVDTLPVLINAVGKDAVSSFDDHEEVFRIEVLELLSVLAKQEVYCEIISTKLSEEFVTTAIEDRDWSTRVAFLNLIFGLGRHGTLKTFIEQMLPDIGGNLQDDESKSNRMAGVRLLSVPGVKETSLAKLTDLVPTLVKLLSDPEEDIRIAVLGMLSELAKQDTFRESINHALPNLKEALKVGDKKTRVAALKTWSKLAEEAAFHDEVNHAASHIAACLKDPDFNVRITALAAFSQFSKDEAFHIAVSEAAPNIISQSENPDWETHVHVLRTLKKFSENDAFSDIINSFVPKIVESLNNRDHDVRFEGVDLLLLLMQQEIYHSSIQSNVGSTGLSILTKLLADRHPPVKTGAARLLSRMIRLETSIQSVTSATREVMRLVVEVDPYEGKDICITSLDILASVVQKEMQLDLKGTIRKIVQLLKSNDLDDAVYTAALRALSVFCQLDDCVQPIMAVVPTILSTFKQTRYTDECRKAGMKVFQELVGMESQRASILPRLFSALVDQHLHIRVLGLGVLLEFIKSDTLDLISEHIQTMLSLLQDPEEDVRIAAIHNAVALRALKPALKKGAGNFHTMIHTAWSCVVAKLQDPAQQTYLTAWDKIPQLAHSIWLADDRQVPNFETPIISALREPSPELHLCALRTVLKLAEIVSFRPTLLRIIPAVISCLSDRRSQVRLQSLSALLQLSEYDELRPRILSHGVQKIIYTSKDRDGEVRSASVKVLIKLAQGADKIPERIKQTTPHLLTLLRHQCTRRDAVALLTCLATDKTVRASLLATIRPLLQEPRPDLSSTQKVRTISWGHLLLIQSLFEKGKMTVEEASDLQFALSLITSKHSAVQDFVLKFMTTTLQRYLARIQTSQPMALTMQNLMEGKGNKVKEAAKGLGATSSK